MKAEGIYTPSAIGVNRENAKHIFIFSLSNTYFIIIYYLKH